MAATIMLTVKNKKTGKIHYSEMDSQFRISFGPKFKAPVFEAYPPDNWEITLTDATATMLAIQKETV